MTRTLGLLAALCVAGCHGKYVRAVSGDPIEAKPERLQRGSYLVNNVLFCGACHTSREHGNNLTEPERTDAYLGGGSVYDDKGIGSVWVRTSRPSPRPASAAGRTTRSSARCATASRGTAIS